MFPWTRTAYGSAPRVTQALLLSALAASLLLPGWVSPLAASAEDEHVYYGYVPREIWAVEGETRGGEDWLSYRIDPESVRTYASVSIIGNQDGTRATVYTLLDRNLVREVTVDKMEEAVVSLPNGSFFKVVTDKPATVILMGGAGMERGEAYTTSWCPSVGGGYVGKEFIFKALQATAQAETGLPYRVFALEAADVTVTDANGSTVSEFHLDPNEVKGLSFTPLGVYRLSATGNVMLQAFYIGWGLTPQGASFYPAVEGGFIGRKFYGCGFKPELVGSPFIPPEYIVTGVSESKLTVYDLEFKREQASARTEAGGRFATDIPVIYLVLESDQPVMFMLRSMGMAFGGLKAGQNAYVYVPTAGNFTGEAYLFAYKETAVTVDDTPSRLRADETLSLTPGLHKISTTENVVIEVLNWAAPTGYHYSYIGQPPMSMRIAAFGQYLPSVQAMSITNEGVRVEPVVGGGLPLTYIAAVVGVAAVIVLLVFVLRRGRRPSAA